MKVYFTEENKKELSRCIDEIVATNWWSEGKYTRGFEEAGEECFGMHSVALTNAGAALYLLYKYAGVQGKDVIIPGNTCWSTVAAAQLAGANIVYADCNREDLCLSYEDLKTRVTKNTVAVTVVHIGGHIAYDIEKIAQFCKENKLVLIEDCAHAHGALWNGKAAGSWGIGGAYSFYATKTLTTGEGGMVVTSDKNVADWCRIQRNYGKQVVDGKITYPQPDGFNFRISELTAAVGCIQMKNMKEILAIKHSLAEKYDQIFRNRVKLPAGMQSGYYKYIIFNQEITQQTGKVFARDDQCCVIADKQHDLPNCQWIGSSHSCPPIFCNWEHADKSVDELAGLLLKR
jgi:perosamine synthetase